MTDLNSLIPAGSGWVLEAAKAINNAGQIAGFGMINGAEHAFLLSPTMTNAAPKLAAEPRMEIGPIPAIQEIPAPPGSIPSPVRLVPAVQNVRPEQVRP